MDAFHVIVTALGGLVLALGLVSKWLDRTPVTPTLLALAFGVVLGPAGLGWVNLDAVGDRTAILEGVTRLVLAVGLMSVALRVPKTYPREHVRTLAVLLGLGMPLMWAASTLLVWAVLGLPVLLAALIGAIVTATDPIAAAPIVTGGVAEANLPPRVRHAISFESGANDGLSYLFVLLPLLWLTHPPGEALTHWLTRTLLWEVGVATLVGVALGLAAGWLLRAAEARDLIEGDWRLVYTVALSLLAVGVGKLLGSDELLVVFVAGVAFAQIVSDDERADEEHGQEAVNRFFSVPFFAVLGTVLPWDGWVRLGGAGLALATAVLLFRRLPALWLLRPAMPSLRRPADALFVGWFGPIAVAAVYYAVLAEHRLGDPRVWDVVTLLIVASTVVHGLSAAPLSKLYGRATGEAARIAAADDESAPRRRRPPDA